MPGSFGSHVRPQRRGPRAESAIPRICSWRARTAGGSHPRSRTRRVRTCRGCAPRTLWRAWQPRLLLHRDAWVRRVRTRVAGCLGAAPAMAACFVLASAIAACTAATLPAPPAIAPATPPAMPGCVASRPRGRVPGSRACRGRVPRGRIRCGRGPRTRDARTARARSRGAAHFSRAHVSVAGLVHGVGNRRCLGSWRLRARRPVAVPGEGEASATTRRRPTRPSRTSL